MNKKIYALLDVKTFRVRHINTKDELRTMISDLKSIVPRLLALRFIPGEGGWRFVELISDGAIEVLMAKNLSFDNTEFILIKCSDLSSTTVPKEEASRKVIENLIVNEMHIVIANVGGVYKSVCSFHPNALNYV